MFRRLIERLFKVKILSTNDFDLLSDAWIRDRYFNSPSPDRPQLSCDPYHSRTADDEPMPKPNDSLLDTKGLYKEPRRSKK
jgi:hypothetical protein